MPSLKMCDERFKSIINNSEIILSVFKIQISLYYYMICQKLDLNRNMHQMRILYLQKIPLREDERYKFLKTITIDIEMHLNFCILCLENKTVKYMNY